MSNPIRSPSNLSSCLGRHVMSSFVMGTTGLLLKGFLYAFNQVEVTGLPRFLDLLDQRRDLEKRRRGLITVSNHVSVIDDPLLWTVLPRRYLFDSQNMRWGLGAHDICFKNKLLASYFSTGQVIPTYRLKHSPHGGLFQPSIADAIRLLSAPQPQPQADSHPLDEHNHPTDPFSHLPLISCTKSRPQPYMPQFASNRHAWVHIFPEGLVHQQPDVDVRYFKWGLGRILLESDPDPTIVPVFIDGTQRIMPESCSWSRFFPRPGKKVHIAFGMPIDADEVVGDLRRAWRELVATTQQKKRMLGSSSRESEKKSTAQVAGTFLQTNSPFQAHEQMLRSGPEARALRIEAARRVRNKVLVVRATFDLPDPNPNFGFAETWAPDHDPPKVKAEVIGNGVKKEMSKVDHSKVNHD